MKSKKRTIGDFGEEIALKYLEKKGYQILDRNFLKHYGEIDIIAIKNENIPVTIGFTKLSVT